MINKLKERLKTIIWSVKLACRINTSTFIFWILVTTAVSLLPAIALYFNRSAVSTISTFLLTGSGSFANTWPEILKLGIVLVLLGVSKRINNDLLYSVMYDKYYFGMEEEMMDCVRQVELKTLLGKEYYDEYHWVVRRGGSLTDFMSCGCIVISKLIGTISLLVVAGSVSPVLCLISAFYICAVIILNMIMTEKMRAHEEKYRGADAREKYFREAVMSPGIARELRIYDTADDMVGQWERSYGEIMAIDRHMAVIKFILSFLSGIGIYICISGMLLYSIFMISVGTLSVDVFLMLYMLGQNMSDDAKQISGGILEADRGLYALDRQRRFIQNVPKQAESDMTPLPVPSDSGIVFEAKNLSFSYDDKRLVLKNLNFQIKKGETIALVGANGSGKSTLVKLLVELFRPVSGELYLCGKPYSEYTPGTVTRMVGMFFQDFYIFHASLRENVGFGDLKKLKDEAAIKDAIEKGGASKILARFPEGFEKWLKKTIKKDGAILSGGENQKVAASRAHMSDKDILIFDEPASALDPIAEMEQFNNIKAKVNGRTAILISHRVGFARLADRIFVLNEGQLAEVGTHDELMIKNGIYADFFNQQAEWYDTASAGGSKNEE